MFELLAEFCGAFGVFGFSGLVWLLMNLVSVHKSGQTQMSAFETAAKAQFVQDGMDDAYRKRLADELFESNICDIDSFTRWVRSRCATSDAFLEEDNIRFLRLIFETSPSSNIHSENRFSRVTRQSVSSHGSPGAPSTVAALHVLTESKTILDTHVGTAA